MTLCSIINVQKIQIIEGNGADDIFLETDLPNGMYPFGGRATLKMSVAKGTGKDYVGQNFEDVPVEIIRRT